MEAGETRDVDERRQFAAPGDLPVASPVMTAAATGSPPDAEPGPALLSAAVMALRRVPPALARAADSEMERGNAFLFAPVCMAAGALSYFTAHEEPSFAVLAICLAIAGVGAFAVLSRPLAHAALMALAMFCAGMLAGKVETLRASTPMLGAEIATRLTGRVVRVENQATGRVRLTLDVVSTERPQLRYPPQTVRVTARAVPAGLAPGDVVKGVARLMPASGPVRPDSYDFAFESYFAGIGAVGFFLTLPEAMAQASPPSAGERLGALVENWRSRIAARIETQVEGPEGAIAAALVTGIRAGIPDEINTALRITGLYHIISISGLHMALVAGTLMVSLRAGFALFPSFSMRRPVKKYAAGFALVATAFYLAMSGGDVAAQRSFIMLGVMLLAVMFDRAALTMRNLAISALIILVVSPHEVMGPSFQMSFAATAALVAAYAAWRDHRARRLQPVRRERSLPLALLRGGAGYAAGLSMTSLVAGLATALFTAWHFQQVSPLGLVANLAAMPVVSVVVMPMAVLALLLMPLGLDAVPLLVMGQGIAAMNAIALWLAERSAFDATGAIPLVAVMVLAGALAILTMAESALRWFSVPLIVLGLGLLAARELPAALVSEDGALVAMLRDDGRIAVNRTRPRAFVMQNWQRAFGGGEIVRPGGDRGFSCEGGLCLVTRADGVALAHAADAESARAACRIARLIVIANATAASPCEAGGALVVTARDLARWGSAEIRFVEGEAKVRFAIAEPYRPWHEHRRFSRAARGLAPWRPPERPSDGQGSREDQTG